MIAQAQPLMDIFASETRQSCHLVLPERGRAVVLAQAGPAYHWEFRVRVGAELDLFTSSSGLVLLAFQNPEERVETLATWGIADAGRRLAGLADQLARIRETGYREGASQQLVGVIDLSVPILGPDGDAAAVLTCPYIEHPDDTVADGRATGLEKFQRLAQDLSLAH